MQCSSDNSTPTASDCITPPAPFLTESMITEDQTYSIKRIVPVSMISDMWLIGGSSPTETTIMMGTSCGNL